MGHIQKKRIVDYERSQSKISELYSKNSIRYYWVGIWPAIPKRLNPVEFDPRLQPGGQPAWMDKIRERLFEIVLPVKKGMSLDCYEAAIIGYYFSAANREKTGRRQTGKSLIPISGKNKDACEKVFVEIEIAKMLEPVLNACLQKKAESEANLTTQANAKTFLKGFHYGEKCQSREPNWISSTKKTNTKKLNSHTMIYCEALLRNWRAVVMWVEQKKSAREMAGFIAHKITYPNGTTYAQKLEKNPNETAEEKEAYLKYFQTLCGRFGIPLPPRGRPRRKASSA